MKKFIFVLALFALVVAPALTSAANPPMPELDLDLDLIVNANGAEVENNVGVISNTGANGAMFNSGSVDIRTGNSSAYAYTDNVVNYNNNLIYDDCGCEPMGPSARYNVDADAIINLNGAGVENNVGVISNTGLNGAMDNGGFYYENTRRFHFEHASGHSGSRGNHRGWHWGEMTGSSHTEMGTTGGDVDIRTGNSSGRADTVNTVNYNVNRIVRGGLAE